jgi:4-azaleucine resistance transporter AzlC
VRSLKRTGDLRDVLALASAVGVVGASFGAIAASAGIPPALTVGMSLLVFAGGSQFLVVSVVAAGGSPVAAVVAGLLINARHLPFGLAMGPVVGTSWPARLLGAHILIDESVAFARARPGAGARRAFWTSGVALFLFWNVGTVVGLVGGSSVPDTDAFGIDAAFPAALLALLLPGLRPGRGGAPDARRVALTAAALAVVATPFLPPGLPVLVGLLALVTAGKPAGTGTP